MISKNSVFVSENSVSSRWRRHFAQKHTAPALTCIVTKFVLCRLLSLHQQPTGNQMFHLHFKVPLQHSIPLTFPAVLSLWVTTVSKFSLFRFLSKNINFTTLILRSCEYWDERNYSNPPTRPLASQLVCVCAVCVHDYLNSSRVVWEAVMTRWARMAQIVGALKT